MFVRLKTGAYAGEVRELSFTLATDLIANGRAEKYIPGLTVPEIKPAEEILVAPVVNTPKVTIAPAKKKKGKR